MCLCLVSQRWTEFINLILVIKNVFCVIRFFFEIQALIHQGVWAPIPHLIRELLIGQPSRSDGNPVSKDAFSWRGFDRERLNLKGNLEDSKKKKKWIVHHIYKTFFEKLSEWRWRSWAGWSGKESEVKKLQRKRFIDLSERSASVTFLFYLIHTFYKKHLYIEKTITYYIHIWYKHMLLQVHISACIIITSHQQRNLKTG